jgi:LacI family xylobiose transport system transcriptional regulator
MPRKQPPAPVHKPATLENIARDAAVSLSTASKVLNGRPGVAGETRERVAKLLEFHGYRKRGTAQTFSPSIDLVFGALDGAWAIELIRGAAGVARENSLSLTVIESGDRHSAAPGWVDAAIQREPVGVILVASDLPPADKYQLRSRNIPFVVVDPAGDPAPDVPSIGSTNYTGGMAATRHLIDLGHRRIGVIAGPGDMMSTRARVAGFRSAMGAADLPVDEALVSSGEFADEAGPEAGVALLSLPNPPTAIFATSDVKALGTYEAARAMGISIPDDLSIVGYDDLQFAKWAGPPLTTVRQPLSDMANEAARLVIRLRSEPRRAVDRLELSTTLIVRGSTKRLG